MRHRDLTLFSDFLPTQLSGLQLWLAADHITGLVDADPVGTWSDRSGYGRDATQATAAKKPTYKVNIQNSHPVVRFDGVDDYLTLGTGLNASLVRSKPFSITAVVKTSAAGTVQIISNAAWATPYVGIELNLTGGKLRFSLNQTDAKLLRVTTTVVTVNDGAPHVVMLTYSGSGAAAGVSMLVDGANAALTTDEDNADGDVTSITNLQVGGRDGSNQCIAADVPMALIYNRALDAGERGRVTRWLGRMYGIGVS